MDCIIGLFSDIVGGCNELGWGVDLYSDIVADWNGFGWDEDIYSDIVVWVLGWKAGKT